MRIEVDIPEYLMGALESERNSLWNWLCEQNGGTEQPDPSYAETILHMLELTRQSLINAAVADIARRRDPNDVPF